MEWFGYVWRADTDITKKLLTETMLKKKTIVRPWTRWKDAVEKDIKTLRKNVSVDMVLNRKRWRGLLVAAQVLQWPLS